MGSKKKRELKVVFDTNILFTQLFGELIKPDVAQVISDHSSYIDLDIRWYLPEIVRHERQYQLEKEALELLPAVGKIEKLLTHNLNITASNLAECVKKVVDHAIEEHSLKALPTDPTLVNWSQVMTDAVYRNPPFEATKAEKGFRDAMIAEAFMQLVQSSPKTPSLCRIVLVANDGRLKEAVEKRIQGASNVRVLPDLEELKGYINTLVSQVSEAVVADIRERARAFFFEKAESDHLYKKENIGKKIREAFAAQLAEKPEEGSLTEQGTWFISSPEFLKKEGQRFFWSTRIQVEVNAFKYATGQSAIKLGELLLASTAAKPGSSPTTGALSFGLPEKKQTHLGKIVFSVEWSVNVNAKKKFIAAKIDNIKYVQTTWAPI